MKPGRKHTAASRALEIRARLQIWRATPESQRPTLRALAAEMQTSHQLLGVYLRGLDEWLAKQCEAQASAICKKSGAEGRPLTWDENQRVEHLHQAAFGHRIEKMLASLVAKTEREMRSSLPGSLSRGTTRVLRALLPRGLKIKPHLLRKHGFILPGSPKRVHRAKAKSFVISVGAVPVRVVTEQ